MSTINVTVKRPCIVAWKCPCCSCVAVVRSYQKETESASLEQGFAPDDVEMTLANAAMKKMENPRLDYADLYEIRKRYKKTTGKEDKSSYLINDIRAVRCPRCGCRPEWCRYTISGRFFSWIFGLSAILLGFLMVYLCMRLRIEPTVVAMLIGILIVMGCMAGILALLISVMNLYSCKPREALHMPLVTYKRSIVKDENDLRSLAMFDYLEKHPNTAFNPRISRRIDIDPD